MIAQSYQIREIKDRIQSAPKSDVSIEIRDSKTNEMISHLVGENVRLISESITSSVAEENVYIFNLQRLRSFSQPSFMSSPFLRF